jgi:hypothetical protein
MFASVVTIFVISRRVSWNPTDANLSLDADLPSIGNWYIPGRNFCLQSQFSEKNASTPLGV